jgi:hypothetical protein
MQKRKAETLMESLDRKKEKKFFPANQNADKRQIRSAFGLAGKDICRGGHT